MLSTTHSNIPDSSVPVPLANNSADSTTEKPSIAQFHIHEGLNLNTHDYMRGQDLMKKFEGGIDVDNAQAASTGYGHVVANDNTDANHEDPHDADGIDADTAEQNQKKILRLFDTNWQITLQQEEDPDWYHKVTTFIEKSIHPRTIDCMGLDVVGTDGKTFLHLILTVMPPKRKRQSQAPSITFEQRRDLFKWVMSKYPNLYYKDVCAHVGYSVLEMAIQRAERSHQVQEVRENALSFIEFFVVNYPQQTSMLLDIDAKKDGTRGLPLVHQLLRMPLILNAKQNQGSMMLLHHLRKATILQPDELGNTVLHLAVAYRLICDETNESQIQLLRVIKKMVETCDEALRHINKAGQSLYQYRVDTHGAMVMTTGEGKGFGSLASDLVAQYLKNTYMHFEKQDEIIRYLYGDMQAYEIHVNLQELSELNVELTRANLEALMENLKFENILHSVRIPKYHLTATPVKAATSRKNISRRTTTLKQEGTSRRDYGQIFDLLVNKGVQKIIKIRVRDDEQNPHSDEVLENLRRFDIEEWDWDRTDICSEILANAAPNLRKLRLYSSGNNAVLRSWSGADGLNQFEKLEEVNVVIYQRLESMDRVQAYKNAFLRRMEMNMPQSRNFRVSVEIKTLDHCTGTTGQAAMDSEAGATPWLRIMDKFARFITNIPSELSEGVASVKVALLDDGIDGLHGSFGPATLKDGISFLTHDYDNVLPFCFSSTGHGTRMATLIRSICPHVHLYVVRLDQYPSADGLQMQPTPESAALGIQWAIKKQVDIISMSWTIAKTENNRLGMAQLEQALQQARKANILMFGASSDQGWNEETPGLPSGFSGVFCIGAATSSGTPEPWSEKEARYVFPGSFGTNINDPRMTAQIHGDVHLRTGTSQTESPDSSSSSFATALATGLVALILYCIDLTGAVPMPQDRRMLRNFEVMGDILDRMCSDNRKYIAVKKYFDPRLANMSWDYESERRLREIVDVIMRPFTDNRRKFI